jgi:hypothetical protein
MLFCQLGRAQSLREICGGLASCEGRLLHLGVKSAPKRSTLSYANEHRPWELYQPVFYQLLGQCQSVGLGRKKFRFRNRLLSLDASVIDLCASLYDLELCEFPEVPADQRGGEAPSDSGP